MTEPPTGRQARSRGTPADRLTARRSGRTQIGPHADRTPIYSTTTGTGGTQNPTVSGTGRYIRRYGTAPATPYGYSLWEFQVYAS